MIKSRIVLECSNVLDLLGGRTNVSLQWVRAHAGIDGNEEADHAAKAGGQEVQSGPEPFIPVPYTYITNLIQDEITRRWNARWKALPTCRQTKNWFPEVNRCKAMDLLKRAKRAQYGLAIQFITGHNFLRRHEALISPGLDKTCRLCEEKEETAFHLAVECPRLIEHRMEAFGERFVNVYDEAGELVSAFTNTDVTNLNLRPSFSIEWYPTEMFSLLGAIEHLMGETHRSIINIVV
jgi:ribonuclease HI